MVSFASGSLTSEVSSKRPLENGRMPKYKPRKVSAVRDFPPGCGSNAVPMILEVEENGGSGAGIVDAIGVKNSEMVEAVVAIGVGASGIKSSIIEVESRSHEAMNVIVDVHMTESLDTLVEQVMANATGFEKSRMEIGSVGTQLPDEVNCDTQGALDSPIELDTTDSLDALVGKVTTTMMDDSSNDVEELITETNLMVVCTPNDIRSDFSNEDTEAGGQTMLKELNEVEGLALVQDSGVEATKSMLDVGASVDKEHLLDSSLALSSASVSIKPETSIRPKDKYRRRRVSAVRDFPPLCGSNVPLPTQEGKQMVTSGNDFPNRIEKVEVEPEATVLSNGSEGGANVCVKTGTTETLNDGGRAAGRDEGSHYGSIEDTGRPVGKEIVAYSPDGNDIARPPYSGNELHREVVHGLMAAPYCPWRKAKVTLNNSDGKTSGVIMRQQNLSRSQKSKSVALNSNVMEDSSGGPSTKKIAFLDSKDADGSPGSLTCMDEEDRAVYNECPLEITPISMARPVPESGDNDSAGPVVKDIVLCSLGETDETRPSNSFSRKNSSKYHGGTSGGKKRKQNFSWRQKAKAVARKSTPKVQFSPSEKHNEVHISNDADMSPGALVLSDDEGNAHDGDFPADSPASLQPKIFEVSLPPFGPNSSGHVDARNRVRDTLRVFHAICRKLLQQEEANSTPEEEGKSKQSGKKLKRIDLLTAKIIKDKGKEVNAEKQILGQVPGVEVGDEFQYRVELAVVGIHRLYQAGIDWMKLNGVPVATSVVSSGAYADDVENADVLIYSGQVRVVRGWKETKVVDPLDPKPKTVTTYVYDGLYTVTNYWTETGSHGKLVFKFELRRNPGQPELAWKELKKSSKFKNRPGACVIDISGGKEPFPICAVNTFGDEKPPPFNYTSKMMYPDWFCPIPPAGSFICEYAGELLEDKEAEQKIGNDEYLFDIGQNYGDSSLKSEDQANSVELMEEVGYTIDAAQYGNIGRFINHSCLPNLYAQNVIYDHDDKKMPHVMLFAMENIPPLQELTYHYNYSVDQIRDSDGNIKGSEVKIEDGQWSHRHEFVSVLQRNDVLTIS
ncbi:UNVERIFIED_CONTAM: Histone-lysine N-methyltransferase, H3 lysine-9 specific SUVH6 [Sesamum radiatum]|uniref:Histone-lysine N-methyltransferase, H3 lysine-9 specific SUVH6 n=1 Tax=Sesamum radiatum TaxID=300843 RepID=A0AAW2MFF4_SESRA